MANKNTNPTPLPPVDPVKDGIVVADTADNKSEKK